MGGLTRALRAVPLIALATCSDSGDPTTTLPEAQPVTRAPISAAEAVMAAQGVWAPVPSWPAHVAIHAHLLPDGEVLFWPGEEGPHKGSKGFQQAFTWNPATGATLAVPNTRTDVFCSGHAFLPNGDLLVVGGHIADDVGRRDANIFSSSRKRWTRVKPMAKGRWYPTAVTLSNGEVLVIAGNDENGLANPVPEVWTARGGWRSLSGASRSLPYYPRMFELSDGRVYYIGPSTQTVFYNVSGAGSLVGGASRLRDRDYGSAVMYGPDRILYVGGGGVPSATAEVFDYAGAKVWQPTGSMAHARRQMNATLLADGTVLATGGTSTPGWNDATGAVLEPELWDPATGQWTPMAPMPEVRLYHSTALLLPDGRVLSAGGGRPAAANDPTGDAAHNHPTADIFTPPYLFAADGTPAARPAITGAPSSVSYGQTFGVQTPHGASIQKVTWIRTGSVTHAHNSDQRINFPAFSVTANGLSVTAPPRNLAPPGYYMLFLIDGNGVPSVARIIRIG